MILFSSFKSIKNAERDFHDIILAEMIGKIFNGRQVITFHTA